MHPDSKKSRFSFLPVVGLLVLSLTALFLLSAATQNIDAFGRLYSWLLGLSLLVLVGLIILIGSNLFKLVRQLQRRKMGSRLTLRMVSLFVMLSVIPAVVVYGFAQQFLHAGIDSWFDVRVDKALDDAMELSRAALDQGMRVRLRRTEAIARKLDETLAIDPSLALDDLRGDNGATEFTLWAPGGRALLTSHADPLMVIPKRPDETLMSRVRRGSPYVGLEPTPDGKFLARLLVPVPGRDGVVLLARYPIGERIGELAGNVEQAYEKYQELAYLRGPLKFSFSLTLVLVLLLSLLTAVWTAFFTARRLVAPIGALAEGTRAVANGDYDTRLPITTRDELGLLVRSFNEMTARIADASDALRRSEDRAIAQRSYLETVLKHLSSGVLTVDHDLRLRSCNPASTQVLGLDLAQCIDQPINQMAISHPRLLPLSEAIEAHADDSDWRAEIHLVGADGRPRILICRGARLPAIETGADLGSGQQVLVFDDVTQLIQAQRDAAWGEVARRLAHEIKNPLTPIQLSAERLRYKYLKKMSAEDGELLARLTTTIIKQVDTMKEMVNAFSDYARSPKLQTISMDLNGLVHEVVDLYRAQRKVSLKLDLFDPLPPVLADAGRLRQVLHNLIKNAQEALEDTPAPVISVASRRPPGDICNCIELTISDNGPGIPAELSDHLFEPYVTNKEKGSGLGLAVVKKILEEHGGNITVDSPAGQGARFTLRLPTADATTTTTSTALPPASPDPNPGPGPQPPTGMPR